MKSPLSIVTLLPLLLAGCSHRSPNITVDVLDTSLSITPRAEQLAQGAIRAQIARMGRGDSLILIPITSDARNDSEGRVLHLIAPSTRQAYDNDLRKFEADAKAQFESWLASIDRHQDRTDILGAIELANQELGGTSATAHKRVIILSDFLEDDASIRFVSSSDLANQDRALKLASKLKSGRRLPLTGVRMCLGRLESTDFARLGAERKQAVEMFWVEYLTTDNRQPALRFDGAGLLAVDNGCDENSHVLLAQGNRR